MTFCIQMDAVSDHCQKYMSQWLTAQNCISLRQFAEQHNCRYGRRRDYWLVIGKITVDSFFWVFERHRSKKFRKLGYELSVKHKSEVASSSSLLLSTDAFAVEHFAVSHFLPTIELT